MEKIKLYNFLSEPLEITLPIEVSDIAAAARLVISGDEVVMILGKDGVKYEIDGLAPDSYRIASYFDSMEFIPVDGFLDYFANRKERQSYHEYREAKK